MMGKLLALPLVLLVLSACGTGQVSPAPISSETVAAEPTLTQPLPLESPQLHQEEPTLKITIGAHTFSASFADNPSAEEFQALLAQGPVTIEMEDYGGFEKVGPLGATLTRCDEAITTQPGDVILYQGNQITIYYATNSWRFTRLAKINDPTNLKAVLGDGSVRVTFSLE